MDGSGPLQIRAPVIFGQHVLAIWLLAHLDIRNGIAAFQKVCNLRSGVFRCPIEHRDRNHGGEITRIAAGVEEIEPDLIALVIIATGAHARDRRRSNTWWSDPGRHDAGPGPPVLLRL